MRRKLTAGNWKMNGTGASLAELAALAESHASTSTDILICPPSTLLSRAADTARAAPLPSAARTATQMPPAPIPAICRQPCSRTLAPPP